MNAESQRLEEAREQARLSVAKAKREAEEIIGDLRRLAMEEGASIKEHKLTEARRKLEDAVPEPVKRTRAPGMRRSNLPIASS